MRTPIHHLSDNQRLLLLAELLDQWSTTKHIPVRKMRLALSADEWAQYEEKITSDPIDPIPRQVAAQFQEYETRLRLADALLCRANNTRGSSRSSTRRFGFHRKIPLQHQADNAYERAVECLQEILSDNPGVAVWLDRSVCFDGRESGVWANAEDAPRLQNSRSQHALRNGRPKRSPRSIAFDSLLASREKLLAGQMQTETATTAVWPFRPSDWTNI